ncbi:PadR family transcriptional regulator [Actinoplanes sp. CA-142083]|uniref:PadR family transcriptional regulator n=1 Tax=Actinoplanes sp. CA-142083 TaxID=3239903 RepID=UPI003D9285B3
MAKAMREPTFWTLTALAQAARHGYGIIQEVSRLSEGQVTLQAGTLYAALDRLAAEGLVEVDRVEKVDGRDRRYYRLTQGGVSALSAEVERLGHNARTAGAQLAIRTGPSAADPPAARPSPARPGFGPATA